MNALVPKHLNRNEVERQSIQCPAPVPFVLPSSEVPGAKDNNKHAIKVRINDETEECVLVFHGGIPEAYLQYVKICENLIRKKDFRTTFKGYAKEEALAEEDIVLHGVNRPDIDAPTENVEESSTSGRIPNRKDVSTPFQKWTKTKSILQNKVDNAQKAQNGVVE